MHNGLVIALRKLACRHSNDEDVVYGECRDIDNHEVVGEFGMAHCDRRDCPLCHVSSTSIPVSLGT